MKNRRSLTSRLFTPVSLKGLRIANYTAAGFVVFYGIIMAFLLSLLERIMRNGGAGDLQGEFIVRALVSMKFLIPFAFAVIALFVLLSELGRSRQLRSEMVALLDQIRSLQQANYTKKRSMRKGDELQPVMDSLHELADRLQKSES